MTGQGPLGRVAAKVMTLSLTVALLFLVWPAPADGSFKGDDIVDWLPNGPDSAGFSQYAGYVLADASLDDHYFYYFVEAAVENPTTKPLIFYLGCQAILCSPVAASFQQLGPFFVDTDGQSLIENPNSWNKEANLLFVEAPVNVGYSYTSQDEAYYNVSDANTVPLLHRFLISWLQRFPEYRPSDVYIAGQNEIGRLAPALALHILHHNRGSKTPAINLKGLIMGDPDLDERISHTEKVSYSWYAGLLSNDFFQQFKRICGNATGGAPLDCFSMLMEVNDALIYFDPYSLYAPPCPDIDLSLIVDQNSFQSFVYTCYDEYVAGYFSIPFVQQALHVYMPGSNPPVWMPSKGSTTWDREFLSSWGMLRAALDAGVRALVYSGTLDYDLPHNAAQESLSRMNMTVDAEWRAWFGKSPIELAGYTTSFKEGLTFATVRNAGRKLSMDQPENVYALFKSFVNNQPLPRSNYFPNA